MTDELSKVYIDEDGNLQFGDQYLEEIEQMPMSGSVEKGTESLEKLFEKLIENTQDSKNKILNILQRSL